VQPLLDKVAMIRDWPQPTNVHEVRQFLGLASYYRRYIRGFAAIATPIFNLLKEGDAEIRKKKFRPIRWTADCELAFRNLKEKLAESPVLIQPDISQPFVIETDASE